MNCRMMFALAVVLVAAVSHSAPHAAQPQPAKPTGMSLALKAGAFAFSLCTGSSVCR